MSCLLLSALLALACQPGEMNYENSQEGSGPTDPSDPSDPGSNSGTNNTTPGGDEIDPGSRTLQRLNRAEYNNTVRDLLGTQLSPATNFPEDDFGYGYNNIADVLSISPLLFDKYMAAADDLIGEVLAGSLSQGGEPIFRGEAEEIGSDVGAAHGDFWNLWSQGAVTTYVDIPFDAEYVVSVRAYGDQGGGEPARMEVMIGGQTIELIDVSAEASAPEVYTTSAQVQSGQRQLAVAFTNDYYDPDSGVDRNLHVDWIEVAPVVDSTERPQVFVCEPQSDQDLACAREILDGFASRAWRRPLEESEVDRLVDLVEQATVEGDDIRTAIAVGLRAVLVSPHFVFRVEKDPQGSTPHKLDQYELATRLSYFLWSSMPDQTLFDLADEGRLDDETVLRKQVERMLDSPKAQAMVDNFASQWLHLGQLDNADPDYEIFPEFDEPLRLAMKKETRRFIAGFFDDERPLEELLNAEYTFLNDRLAEHYDIDQVDGPDMRRVDLQGDDRGGLLTQGSILTATSYPKRTSPVQRGHWVMGQLLCRKPPPPPPGVENIDSEGEAAGKTLREIMEQHTADPACASCHAMMDPIGFGMSNYDAIGGFREMQNGQPVDSSGTLPDGSSFHGARELSEVISKDPAFTRCVTRQVMTYAVGRGIERPADEPIIDLVVERTESNGGTMRELIKQVVLSPAFQMRRAETTDEQPADEP